MKKINFAWLFCLVAIFSLSLTSCGDDDDDDIADSAIVGVWQSTYFRGYVNGVLDEEDEDDTEYYNFKSDGTFTYAMDDDGVWVVSNGNWKMDGKSLVLVDNEGNSDKATIKSISDSKLVLSVEETFFGSKYTIENDYKKVSAMPEGAVNGTKSK